MFGPTFVGAVYGFGVKVGMNALRKQPYLRGLFLFVLSRHLTRLEPYVHVMFAGAGAAIANWVVDCNVENKEDIANIIAYLEKPEVVRKEG